MPADLLLLQMIICFLQQLYDFWMLTA